VEKEELTVIDMTGKDSEKVISETLPPVTVVETEPPVTVVDTEPIEKI